MIRWSVFVGLILLPFLSFAQEDTIKNRFAVTGQMVVRSMQTTNKGDLSNFYGTVTHGHLGVSYQLNSWIKLNATGYGLLHFGLDGIAKIDPSTLNGPIYEGNLWNPIWMDGDTHFAIPVANVEFNYKGHQLTLGRFLFNSPLINPEPWPFPNASEGILYQMNKSSTKLQVAFIDRFASRFDARFHDIGGSLGRGANGFRVDGGPSRYLNNTQSDFILAAGIDHQFSEGFGLTLWNFYTDNVNNTFLIEPKFSFDNDWSASALYLQQNKVNDGGNSDPQLTYFPDERAAYLGLRVEKRLSGHQLQFNYSRIFDQGRLQLTRDWGLEPIYTFQRRTRTEGHANMQSIMMKWTNVFMTESGAYRVFSSFSRTWLPFPDDYARSKYRQPSNYHLDTSVKYSPTGKLKGLSAELYVAYRFLAEDLAGDDRFLINRADIFHSDLILSYTF